MRRPAERLGTFGDGGGGVVWMPAHHRLTWKEAFSTVNDISVSQSTSPERMGCALSQD